MNEFLPIYYSGFWDVPDAFLTVYKGDLFLFWREAFDTEIDDYPPDYKIYLVKNTTLEKSFEPSDPPYEFVKFCNISLLLENEIIGKVPTKEVVFDQTKRKFINSKIFKQLQKIN